MADKFIVRKSDGKIYRASYPRFELGEGSPFEGLGSGKSFWYFREIHKVRGPWYLLWVPQWKETGDIWKPEEGKEFDVYDWKWRKL